MINIPYNVPLTPQIMPTQNVPVQTSHNNFQPFQQPPSNTQQMQTNPAYPINPQDPYKSPFYQFQQSDMFMANQYVPNILYPRTIQPFNVPPTQSQPNYSPLLQNILEQIRGQVSNTAPIFILPGGCQQSTNHHQQAGTVSQGGSPQATGPPTSFNYPSSTHCPPSFYPYPIPLPVYEPFVGQTRNRESSRGCGCCHRRQESLDSKNYSLNCCCNLAEQEDHRCTVTNDDTVCSKRNCPTSVSLQALASQFLSLPGIISCAATRLILRKVPGSNITNTMEDTMDKAQKAISVLTKEQLLTESRNAQQVNALINLHMTTNPPANIIPLLTLIQLKVNVLKAQIESLINKKVMECQGFGYEVETSSPIDPTVLSMKTNEELRQLLSALRQKECDERVNVNFSPYHSQRVIAESRLNNVQAKIRQVEAEFDRRRSVSLPVPSLASRVIQQFAGSTCTFGFAQTKLFEPCPPESPLESPDPFSASLCNPKRLYLKPRVPEPETAQQKDENKATCTSQDPPPTCKDTGTGESSVDCTKERSVGPRSSEDSCSCHSTSSEESIDEGKKKLRLRIDRTGKVTISSPDRLEDASLANFSPNVVLTTDQCRCKFSTRSVSDKEDDVADRETRIREIFEGEDKETGLEEKNYVETKEAKEDEREDTKDEIPDTSKEEDFGKEEQRTFDDGQVLIKEEPKSDTKSVKTEPEAIKHVETAENVNVAIKKEPEDKSSWFRTMLNINVKTKEMKKTEMQIEPKQTAVAQPSDAVFVTEKQIQIGEKPAESRKLRMKDIKIEDVTETRDVKRTDDVDLKTATTTIKRTAIAQPSDAVFVTEKQIQIGEKPGKSKKLRMKDVTETRDVQGTDDVDLKTATATIMPRMKPTHEKITADDTKTKVHVSSKPKKVKKELYIELQQKPLQETKDVKTHEKRTVEDVSKDPVSIIVTPPGEETSEEKPSSDVEKSYFGITLKKPGGSKHRAKIRNDETNDAEVKEKLIVEDVSKQQVTGSATPAEKVSTEGEGSSEVQKSYFGITLKKRGESKQRPRTEDDKSQPKSGRHGNAQIISMMTHMKYDRGFGDFDEWVDINECINGKTKDQESRRSKDNSLTLRRDDKMFPKNHRSSNRKNINGTARFPPLKNATRRVIDVPENIFHQEEIESGSSKTFCHRNPTYHPVSENSIVSAIYSAIESQLTSFGSFFANIPNLQNIVSSFYCNKWSSIIFNHNTSTTQNETEISEKDDWILLPATTDDDDGTSNESCISVTEGFNNIHRIKRSIVVDKETKNYVSLEGSISGQLKELSRNGFKRPYHVRRTLVIRSRLKNPRKSKEQRPFTILKRTNTNKILVSREINQEKHETKNYSLLSIDHSLSENESVNMPDRFSDSEGNKQV